MNDTASIGVSCVLLLVFIFFVGGFLSIRVVAPTEVAVVSRFGTIVGVFEPGLYVLPLAAGDWYDTRVQKYGSNEAAATKDLQDVTVNITVNYQFQPDKIEEVYLELGSQEMFVSTILQPIVSQNIKTTTATYNAEALVANRAEVAQKAQEAIAESMATYPVTFLDLNITNITFTSQEFNAAIEDKQIAEQKALQAEFELQQAQLQKQTQEQISSTLDDNLLRKMFIEKWNGVLPQYMSDDGVNILLGK